MFRSNESSYSKAIHSTDLAITGAPASPEQLERASVVELGPLAGAFRRSIHFHRASSARRALRYQAKLQSHIGAGPSNEDWSSTAGIMPSAELQTGSKSGYGSCEQALIFGRSRQHQSALDS